MNSLLKFTHRRLRKIRLGCEGQIRGPCGGILPDGHSTMLLSAGLMPAVLLHMASATKMARSLTHARWYYRYTLLERLAKDLQHMASELRQFIQKEDTMVRQRHVAWYRHLTAADQAHIGDRMVRGTKEAHGHESFSGCGCGYNVLMMLRNVVLYLALSGVLKIRVAHLQI